jgi:hypothetical protein
VKSCLTSRDNVDTKFKNDKKCILTITRSAYPGLTEKQAHHKYLEENGYIYKAMEIYSQTHAAIRPT